MSFQPNAVVQISFEVPGANQGRSSGVAKTYTKILFVT
jgi:hypothetical protein